MHVYMRGRQGRRLLDVLVLLVVIAVLIYAALSRLNVANSVLGSVTLTLIFGVLIIELFGGAVFVYMSRNVAREEAGTLRNLFRIVAYVILVIVLLAELNINVTGLLVSAGFLGIVLGLAAQSTISNFISGIYLLSSKTFEPGDRVIIHTWQYTMQPQSYPHDKFIPGFAGTIRNIGILYTELLDNEGLAVYVPNNIVAQAMVINYHRAEERMTRLQFDVDIGISFAELERRLAAVLKRNHVAQHRIDIEYLHNDLYVVTLRLKADIKDIPRLKSAIYKEVIDYLKKKERGR